MGSPRQPGTDLASRARMALRTARTGDFAPAAAVLDELGSETESGATAWKAALRSAWWMAAPGQMAAPDFASMQAAVDVLSRSAGRSADEGRSAAAFACAHMEQAAILALDPLALARWTALHDQLAPSLEEPEARAWLDATRLWADVARGDPEGSERASDIQARASDIGEPSLVVQVTALRALSAATEGQLDEALASARRASRMAASEGLPAAEYLANLVLARMRRLEGKPHLAARILGGLDRVVPPAWRGWLALEMLLASGPEALETVPDGGWTRGAVEDVAATCARTLDRGIGAASAGRRKEFERAFDELSRRLEPCPALAGDVAQVQAAIDPRTSLERVSPPLRAWCEGVVDVAPPSIRGVCIPEGGPGEGESAVAWVVAGPALRPRRVARPGVGLVLADDPQTHQLPQAKRKSGRTDKALATLALAGEPGMDEAELFRAAYGFAYSPALHQEVLRVLVHRSRARLGESGRLSLGRGHVQLTLHGHVLVPDPRCSQPMDDRVLRWLARRGRASAQDVAKQCGISLRAAQAALQQLTAEGACAPQRQGRRIEYRVEDTTYCEPTRS